jgi:hypothetical protein
VARSRSGRLSPRRGTAESTDMRATTRVLAEESRDDVTDRPTLPAPARIAIADYFAGTAAYHFSFAAEVVADATQMSRVMLLPDLPPVSRSVRGTYCQGCVCWDWRDLRLGGMSNVDCGERLALVAIAVITASGAR